MGVIRDIIKSADNSNEVTAEVKETLAVLMTLASAKGGVAEGKIREDLTTGRMGDGLNIPVTKIIESRVEYRAITKNGAADIVNKAKESIAKLFSGDGKILEGIAGIVNTALVTIIGEGEGQEAEISRYCVIAEYPAIVRYDFYFWGRNIRAKSIKEHMESVFTCVVYKSAVDVSKLKFNDFLAVYAPVLNAAYQGEASKLEEFIQQAKKVYMMLLSDRTSDRGGLVNNLTLQEEMEIIRNPHIEIPSKIITRQAIEGDF